MIGINFRIYVAEQEKKRIHIAAPLGKSYDVVVIKVVIAVD